MMGLNLAEVWPGRKPLGDELADSVQHPAAGLGGAVWLDHAVPDQGLRQLQHPAVVEAGDLGGSMEAPAVGEHRRDL